jgi:hypothetical protein
MALQNGRRWRQASGPDGAGFSRGVRVNGTDDKHIATVDEDGVALAAIQGLNEKVESSKWKAESRQPYGKT